MGSQAIQYFNLELLKPQESIDIDSSTVITYQAGNQQGGARYYTLFGQFKIMVYTSPR